ncbi:MAG: DUF4037 domain-containing protein [Actinobacteria bacterium]|nr:DUF4037 domain-containing protein [Actinomycetota bacterium]
MTEFIPGLELARAFYEEVVSAIVGDTPHSAARLGWGSDVLGFDTERSADHGWGPHLQVFVEADVEQTAARIDSGLPDEFRGWPVRYGWDDRPVVHHVEVTPLGPWLEENLGFDPRPGMSTRDWLTTPQQLLLGVTRGAVFHDGLSELEPLRASLEWYPREVWLWLLACQWRRLDQEEHFVGRTAEVGDELGSRILAARLARDLVLLCFLLERRYAPYVKWLGSAFAQLEAAAEVGSPLERALAATDYPSREHALSEAVEAVARRHNALGLTEPAEPTVRPFYTRPFRVLSSRRFVDACLAEISDPWLRSLPLVGSIDQLADSTDVLSNPPFSRRLGGVYGE